jgi:hypothetical protein
VLAELLKPAIKRNPPLRLQDLGLEYSSRQVFIRYDAWHLPDFAKQDKLCPILTSGQLDGMMQSYLGGFNQWGTSLRTSLARRSTELSIIFYKTSMLVATELEIVGSV